MTVVDLTADVQPTKFLREAETRGCIIVAPGRLLVEQVRAHVRKLGGDVPADLLNDKFATWAPEE